MTKVVTPEANGLLKAESPTPTAHPAEEMIAATHSTGMNKTQDAFKPKEKKLLEMFEDHKSSTADR